MDILSYILGKKAGGGGEAVLINKNVNANGTYNASSDDADGYKKVVVSVPNTYAAGDEGKVVSNGALVAQGSDTVTANDTYDTTLISELTVNVPVPAFETGTYIGAGGGNIVRTINTTKKWSHFLIVTEDTYSQLTTDSLINLYMAYGDAYGYTAVPINVKDGGYGALAVENRPPSSYDNCRSQLTFNDNNIKWAFMGNGAIMSPVVGANYKWFAW